MRSICAIVTVSLSSGDTHFALRAHVVIDTGHLRHAEARLALALNDVLFKTASGARRPQQLDRQREQIITYPGIYISRLLIRLVSEAFADGSRITFFSSKREGRKRFDFLRPDYYSFQVGTNSSKVSCSRTSISSFPCVAPKPWNANTLPARKTLARGKTAESAASSSDTTTEGVRNCGTFSPTTVGKTSASIQNSWGNVSWLMTESLIPRLLGCR